MYARYCTGKFVLFSTKGEGKARLQAASIVLITDGRGIVYISHLLMRFLDGMNLISGGS